MVYQNCSVEAMEYCLQMHKKIYFNTVHITTDLYKTDTLYLHH
jgi:hypothetical protein